MSTSIDVACLETSCPLERLERLLYFSSSNNEDKLIFNDTTGTAIGSNYKKSNVYSGRNGTKIIFPNKSPTKPQRQISLTYVKEDACLDDTAPIDIPPPVSLQGLVRVETTQSYVSALTFDGEDDIDQDLSGYDFDFPGFDKPPSAPRRHSTSTMTAQTTQGDVFGNNSPNKNQDTTDHDDDQHDHSGSDHDHSGSDQPPRFPRRRSTKRATNLMENLSDNVFRLDTSDNDDSDNSPPRLPKRRSTKRLLKTPLIDPSDLIDNDTCKDSVEALRSRVLYTV